MAELLGLEQSYPIRQSVMRVCHGGVVLVGCAEVSISVQSVATAAGVTEDLHFKPNLKFRKNKIEIAT